MDSKAWKNREEEDLYVHEARKETDLKVKQERAAVDKMIKEERENMLLLMNRNHEEMDEKIKKERDDMLCKFKQINEEMDLKLQVERKNMDGLILQERADMDLMTKQERADMDQKFQELRNQMDHQTKLYQIRMEEKVMQDRARIDDQSPPTKRKCQDDGSDRSRKTVKMTPAHSPSHYIVVEMGCKLTSAQEARVNQLVEECCTGIPFYVTVMNKKSLSDGYQVICKEYAVNHLPHQDQAIKLCRHPQTSKTWDASLKLITDGTCILWCILSTGWMGFVRDNRLQEGDICALEVLKSDGVVTITVHHVQESPHPEHVGTGHTKPTRQQKTKVTHKGYVMTTQATRLTDEQERKIEERLQVIQPKIEIFVSVMRSNSHSAIYFKQSYADAHLPREDKIMKLERPGKERTWAAELRIGDKHNLKSYELRRGWGDFFRENELQEGDMCLFELLENEEEPTMNVHIIRRE